MACRCAPLWERRLLGSVERLHCSTVSSRNSVGHKTNTRKWYKNTHQKLQSCCLASEFDHLAQIASYNGCMFPFISVWCLRPPPWKRHGNRSKAVDLHPTIWMVPVKDAQDAPLEEASVCWKEDLWLQTLILPSAQQWRTLNWTKLLHASWPQLNTGILPFSRNEALGCPRSTPV